MTKDDKEFFDKAMLAALTGLVARGCWSAADASDMAIGALKRRNVVLQELGYQDLPQAEPLPSFFSAPPIPLISGDLTPSAALKEHLHGDFSIMESSKESPEITSHEVPADVNLCTKTGIPVRSILAAAKENKGKKLTTTEIFWLIYPGGPSLIDPPNINVLRDIGVTLRRHGYQIKRSGGKDLYQL